MWIQGQCFDYAFSNFSKVSLKDQPKAEGVSSYLDDAPYVVLPTGIDFSSLESEITITDKREAEGKGNILLQRTGCRKRGCDADVGVCEGRDGI